MSGVETDSPVFTYEEALKTFPRVRELTAAAVKEMDDLFDRVSREELEEKRAEIERQAQEIYQTWARQMTEIGCEVKGLWLVDWDTGDGYYCWRWPEESLGHYHGYEEGFDGRVPVQ